jgi:hypothetical protein
MKTISLSKQLSSALLKISFSVFILIFLSNSKASAQQEQSSFDKKVSILLNESYSDSTQLKMIKSVIAMNRKIITNLPDTYWQKLETKMLASLHNDLVAEMTRLYKENLAEEDIDALIAFNNTPTGKKFKLMQPLLASSINEFAQKFGKKIALEIKAGM